MSPVKKPEAFLVRGLAELANKKGGHIDVFEAEDGSLKLAFDPPQYLLQALDMAAKGDGKALRDVFKRHGFGPDAAAVLADLIIRRGRGRPPISTPEQLYEERLKQIKKELRRNGASRVHQNAMRILDAEHQSCLEWANRTGMALPEINFDKLANRTRRSKRPQKKRA
jgi:hypothetical protein